MKNLTQFLRVPEWLVSYALSLARKQQSHNLPALHLFPLPCPSPTAVVSAQKRFQILGADDAPAWIDPSVGSSYEQVM